MGTGRQMEHMCKINCDCFKANKGEIRDGTITEILIWCSPWVLQLLHSGKRFYLDETKLFQLAVDMDKRIQRQKAT